MDTHPFETWNQLVHSLLHPAVLLQSQGDLNGYLVTAKELKEALSVQLLRDTLYNKTETEMGWQVERYQILLTNLLNKLFNYQHYKSITSELKQFYQAVSARLEAILDWLQNTFGGYFNAGLEFPLPFRFREGHEWKRNWKIIAGKLNSSPGNTPIVTILDQYLKNTFHPETAVTCHQAACIRNLLKELLGYLSTTAVTPEYASVTELLICWNFNEVAFIREVCNGIRTEADNKEPDERRFEFLRSRHKQVSQLLEKGHTALHPGQPTVKQAILEWLAHELTWLEDTTLVPEKKAIKEGIKIHTSITVPMLALITRLFKESGIVTNANQTEILQFFATQFTTLHKAEFSYGHLRSKYYEVDERTKKKVCDYLLAMVQLCKKL